MSDEGNPTVLVTVRHPQEYFFLSLRVANCVFCGAEAARFGGHVHSQGNHILRGWCKKAECERKSRVKAKDFRPGCVGCYGRWTWKYGMTIELNNTDSAELEFRHVL